MISRRSLMGGIAAGAATLGALTACTPGADPELSPAGGGPPLDPADWASVRAQFNTKSEVAHLATFVFASPPAPVRAAVAKHRAGFDLDAASYLHEHQFRQEEAMMRAAARYLHTTPGQISLTDSTTMGLGLLYNGLKLRPGDEILTTEHDFYSTHEALRLRAQRDTATVRRVKLFDDPAQTSVDEITGRLANALTPNTAVVAVTWVHSSTGVKLPIKQLADVVAEHNRGARRKALLCVDAVHGFGAEDPDMAKLGCDFLVSGCHKWLYGPRGTGLIWGTEQAWGEYDPIIPPFDGPSADLWLGRPGAVPSPRSASPGGYHAFEHQWALAQAFEFHQLIGPDRVTARIHELAGQLKDGLSAIDGVRLVTPKSAELSAGIVCFEVRDLSADIVTNQLPRHGVIGSSTPYAVPYVRLGAGIANNEQDVEKAVRAVELILRGA